MAIIVLTSSGNNKHMSRMAAMIMASTAWLWWW